ncbi:MAG: hypothetical protein ABEJ96_03515 [Thiohalorhabdaceae bacterium]
MLEEGYAQGQQLPETLFIPHEESADILTAEAEGQGITVSRVPEDELLVFIGEAREAFWSRTSENLKDAHPRLRSYFGWVGRRPPGCTG